jgi:hypothetical protein
VSVYLLYEKETLKGGLRAEQLGETDPPRSCFKMDTQISWAHTVRFGPHWGFLIGKLFIVVTIRPVRHTDHRVQYFSLFPFLLFLLRLFVFLRIVGNPEIKPVSFMLHFLWKSLKKNLGYTANSKPKLVIS